MQALTTIELFSVWEQTLDQPVLVKTLRLLKTASDGDVNVATLPIGERDARLFRIRDRLFGHRMYQTATCPACSEKIEWETRSEDMLVKDTPSLSGAIEFNKDGYEIQFRLVNSADIMNLVNNKIPLERSKKYLLHSCLLQIKRSDRIIDKEKLPAEIADALENEMSKQDPLADIQLNLACPACAHQWQAGFDIMQFFWTEINSWAQRLMQEVFLLARSFSWSEKDILAMSPRRRQLYLQMINT